VDTIGLVRAADDPEVALLQALADPSRLAIVRKLASDGEAGAGEFSACCPVAQPTISHHLKVLRQAGIVASHRHGTSIRYRLHPRATRTLSRLVNSLLPTPAGTLNAGAQPTQRKPLGGPAS
jgi:ArsR family transcriptional regulator